MKSIFVAAFLALASGGGCSLTPAMAQSLHGECRPFEPLYKEAQVQGWTQEDIKGPDLVRFLANYNAVDPPTDIHPDRVLIATIHGNKSVTVIFVNKGCMIGTERTDEEEVIRLLTTEVGNPA